jgi:hypothetical protein
MAITPKQAQQQLIRMGDPRAIRRALTNAFRRGGGRVRADAIRSFRSRGIGRRIFGGKKFKQKDAMISLGRVRGHGDSVQMDITARGFAAIQEIGGTTRPHVIAPKNFAPRGVPLLVFRVPGALVITSKPVHHPGSRMPRIPSLAPALERGAPMIGDEIRRALDTHIDGALR